MGKKKHKKTKITPEQAKKQGGVETPENKLLPSGLERPQESWDSMEDWVAGGFEGRHNLLSTVPKKH